MKRSHRRHRPAPHTGRPRLRVGARCHLCTHPISNADELTWDHIRPRSHGGKNKVAPAHQRCNVARGNLPMAHTAVVLGMLGPSRTPAATRVALMAALKDWMRQQAAEGAA